MGKQHLDNHPNESVHQEQTRVEAGSSQEE
jgi:hypothetical protein